MPYFFDHFDSVKEIFSLVPFGLLTDIDGTISEIAPSPGDARVTTECRESLAVLVQHVAVVAAVSGRSVEDARKMVGIDEMVYIGNHGYETWSDGKLMAAPGVEGYSDRIKVVLKEFNRLISMDGLIIENKGFTASIHYRRCRNSDDVYAAIIPVIDKLAIDNGLKVNHGKMVVELRPPLDISKGTSVISLIGKRGLCGAVYLGDDMTDVDVFNAFHRTELPFRGLTIGVVGEETAPEVENEADFTVNGVRDVERFLRQVALEVVDRPVS